MLLFASVLIVRGPAAACGDAPPPAPAASEPAFGKPRDFGTATRAPVTVAPAEKPPAGVGAQSVRGVRSVAGAGAVVSASATANVPLCTSPADQSGMVLVADRAGGGIVVWQDRRGGHWDIYAQRLRDSGQPDWIPNGIPVCKAGGQQERVRAAADGMGGLIVAWQDARGDSATDIYAQRLTSAGTAAWANGGVLVCGALGSQRAPVVVDDGQGGAVVAWLDDRALGSSDVYVQRVSASGVLQWGAPGVALCTAAGVQDQLAVVSDGQRGAIVTWRDGRSDGGDIYARRVTTAGVAQWAANGVALCAATGVQEAPAVVGDGAGGLVAVWEDARAGALDIYARRVDGAGAPQWAANGVAACAEDGDQRAPALCEDGQGGVVAAWQDGRPGGQWQEVYAQRLDEAGAPQWAANGVGVCTAAGDQLAPALVRDPVGGVLVAWCDGRSGTSGIDIYVQHVADTGAGQWTAQGVLVCDAANGQEAVRVMADGLGGAQMVWQDHRAGPTTDLYGQHVDAAGQMSDGCLTTTLVAESTPVTPPSQQSYYTIDQSELYWCGVGVRSQAGSDWDLEIYEPVTFGSSRYPTCFSGPLAGSFAATGVDFAVGNFNIGHTPVVIPGSGAGYGVRVFRSSGAGTASVEWDDNPNTIARDCGTGGGCGAKSGNNWTGILDVWDVYLFAHTNYRFDFTREGQADIRLLLFGSVGTSGTFFAPRSARLFETTAASEVFSAPATAWYGVVLVNEDGLPGTYTVRVVTTGQTDVEGSGEPATGLLRIAPNPASGSVSIQFALREPGPVAFELLDLTGRVVAEIPERAWEAGTWSVSWEGRTARAWPRQGVYFVRMRVDGRPAGIARLAVVR